MEITQPPVRTLRPEEVLSEADTSIEHISESEVLFEEGSTLKMGAFYDCVESRVPR
jgi:hypothetical protein